MFKVNNKNVIDVALVFLLSTLNKYELARAISIQKKFNAKYGGYLINFHYCKKLECFFVLLFLLKIGK